MRFPPQALEEWYRVHDGDAIDLSSSGVHAYSVAELCELTGLDPEEILALRLDDTTSLGTREIREAAAARFANGDPDELMIGNGSSEVLFLALSVLLEPGDEVVVPVPGYHALSSVAETRGCTLREWSLERDGGFAADLDALAGLVGPRTKAVVVNFPHNPTGITLSRHEYERLLEIVDAAGAWLVWDAAFEELVYDAPALPSPRERYARSITTGTLSKAYGLPGLRLGWCVAPADVLTDTIGLRDRTTLFVSVLVEKLAIAAIRHGDALVHPRLEEARRNRDRLRTWIQEQADHVSWTPAGGGVCAFPRLHGIGDTDEFCERLAAEQRVLLVPGTAFGDREGRVRLGFGGAASRFEEGLALLGEVLAAVPHRAAESRR